MESTPTPGFLRIAVALTDNIPEELKKLDQWVCANDGSKVPMKAWENEAASSTNPETWSSFFNSSGILS